jgi:hypothetical protein
MRRGAESLTDPTDHGGGIPHDGARGRHQPSIAGYQRLARLGARLSPDDPFATTSVDRCASDAVNVSTVATGSFPASAVYCASATAQDRNTIIEAIAISGCLGLLLPIR